jgi:hypothetical protein
MYNCLPHKITNNDLFKSLLRAAKVRNCLLVKAAKLRSSHWFSIHVVQVWRLYQKAVNRICCCQQEFLLKIAH